MNVFYMRKTAWSFIIDYLVHISGVSGRVAADAFKGNFM